MKCPKCNTEFIASLSYPNKERAYVCQCGHAWTQWQQALIAEKDKRIEALEGMLRELEWDGASYHRSGHYFWPKQFCPVCEAFKQGNGHKPDCKLSALLNGQNLKGQKDENN